jgi:hypothetical protein
MIFMHGKRDQEEVHVIYYCGLKQIYTKRSIDSLVDSFVECSG